MNRMLHCIRTWKICQPADSIARCIRCVSHLLWFNFHPPQLIRFNMNALIILWMWMWSNSLWNYMHISERTTARLSWFQCLRVGVCVCLCVYYPNRHRWHHHHRLNWKKRWIDSQDIIMECRFMPEIDLFVCFYFFCFCFTIFLCGRVPFLFISFVLFCFVLFLFWFWFWFPFVCLLLHFMCVFVVPFVKIEQRQFHSSTFENVIF